jgi:hypothetical protein
VPWLDREKVRKYQREWRKRKRLEDTLWHEHEKALKREYGHPEYYADWHHKRADENERHWRFTMQEVARMQKEHSELVEFYAVSAKELLNPDFVFVLAGRRHYENLHSPLPKWGNDA